MADKNLEIVIKAVNQSQSQMNEVNKSLGDMKKNFDGVKNSAESQATSVFKGVAVYDLFRTALNGAVSLFQSSMAESREASILMAQVETNVKNAGFAYDELAPKMKEYGENALAMGFDDEEAMQGLSKLLIVTKDYEQARALANLSMDLARSKGIDLQSAQKAIALVTQGNTKALKEYGIEGETTAEVLVNAHTAMKDSALNYANSAGGSYEVLLKQWDEMKQKIGDDLQPQMQEMFQMVSDNKGTILALADGFIFLAKSLGFVVKGFVGFGKIFATGISSVAEKATKDLSTVTWALNQIGLVSDDTVKKNDDLAQSWSDTTQAMVDDTLSMYDETPKLTKTIDDTSKALANVKNKAKDTASALTPLQQAVLDAGDAFKSLHSTTNETLASLEDANSSTMNSINSDMETVRANIKSLTSEYKNSKAELNKTFNEGKQGDDKSIAEAIVANETRIADIQKELAGEVTRDKQAELKKELADRIASQQTNADFIKQFEAQVAEVKRVNALSELDQEILKYNQKRTLAQQDFNERMALINSEYKTKKSALDKEMTALSEKMTKEKAIYTERQNFILGQLSQADATQKNIAMSAIKTTEAQVKTQIAYYEQLAKAIKASQNASTSEFTNIKKSVSTVSIPKFANGGIVDRPTLALIGEAGPEAVVPLNGKSGMGGITININGGTYLSEEVAEDMGNKIIKVLQLNQKIS
jgi:hypothetical protein